jgi:hypothetical protein
MEPKPIEKPPKEKKPRKKREKKVLPIFEIKKGPFVVSFE